MKYSNVLKLLLLMLLFATGKAFAQTAVTLPSECDNCSFNPFGVVPGEGSLTGRTCFDIALSNDNTNSCGKLTARTASRADFTQAATHTQTYTFTPKGTVSNVRFYYINEVGNAVIAISGNNTGNNIAIPVNATVNYNTNNNTLALGLTRSNPMVTRIFVVYNVNATNTNNPADDRILSLTARVKDCACCGAPTVTGGFLVFMCHNLGADQTADPFTPSWKLNGAYIQFGYKGPADWQTATNTINFAAAPTGSTLATANYLPISGWSLVYNPLTTWNVDENNPVKTAADPCPTGFRVPTETEFRSTMHVSPNTVSSAYLGNWVPVNNNWAPSPINYSTGMMVGQNLYLPATGYRFGTNTPEVAGELRGRGIFGAYNTSNGRGLLFRQGYMYGPGFGIHGASVRCISE